jgi:TRAP-type uncharacterized transport system fused permease subunit
MNYENIIKSWFTTILGCIAMGLSLFGWWFDQLTDWQGVALFIIGFALLFMRDKISGMIEQVIAAAINKFSKPS